MNKQLTFSFIGGDLRQTYVIAALCAAGFHVRAYGYDSDDSLPEKVYAAVSAPECIDSADVVVLPLPYTTDYEIPLEKRTINTTLSSKKVLLNEILDCMDSASLLFVGKADAQLTEECREREILMKDYADREELAVMNAIPTAEGALELAMANTVKTLHGTDCLVIGYGRIGKILSADLRSLGARVTVTARRCSDIAWIKANGFCAEKTADIKKIVGGFDIIFNTVPNMVIDFNALSKTRSGALIIDLASKPGGVDFTAARELDRRVIWGLSLPGKVAPETAGNIIKDTLLNILEESEV